MRMQRLPREAALWLPPLLLMALIFIFSAMPGAAEERGFWYFLSRKVAHFAEYALLMALWWRALRTRMAARMAIGLAFALTVGYGITDEIHQRSVENRIGTPRDVVIDAAGAAAAAGLILRRRGRVRAPESG